MRYGGVPVGAEAQEAQTDPWSRGQLTCDEVRELPPVVNFATAARAWGLSRSQAYALRTAGKLPFRTIQLTSPTAGRRRSHGQIKVRLADLLDSLGLS